MKINDKIESINEIEAEIKNGYKYVILYRLSDVKIIPIEKFEGFNEVKEAIFFNMDKELKCFNYNGQFRGVVIEDEADDKNIEPKSRRLFSKLGYKTLKIKEYITYDEDGQVYVQATRVCGIE